MSLAGLAQGRAPPSYGGGRGFKSLQPAPSPSFNTRRGTTSCRMACRASCARSKSSRLKFFRSKSHKILHDVGEPGALMPPARPGSRQQGLQRLFADMKRSLPRDETGESENPGNDEAVAERFSRGWSIVNCCSACGATRTQDTHDEQAMTTICAWGAICGKALRPSVAGGATIP
jgi:hypothetical protein